MNELITAIPTGITAFAATNIDDMAILLLLFTQINATFRRRDIVFGQYIGLVLLVLASLPGFFGSFIVPRTVIGLLGVIPIAVGLSKLLNREDEEINQEEVNESPNWPFASFLSPQICSVAAITIANGSDNIGIYVPLFANSSWVGLVAIVAVFLLLVGVWCYATYKLTQQPAIANLMSRYGNTAVPFILIGLGAFIVLDSQALSLLALIASCLCLAGLVKKREIPVTTEAVVTSNIKQDRLIS